MWAVVAIAGFLMVALVLKQTTLLATALVIGVLGLMTGWRVHVVQHSAIATLAERNSEAVVRLTAVTDARELRGGFSSASWLWARTGAVTTPGRSVDERMLVDVRVQGSAGLAAGDVFTARGRLREHPATRFAARLDATDYRRHGTAAPWWTAANAVRGAVAAAAERGPPGGAVLVPALVHGDDSRQDAATAEAFRASGLTHLLAVSGTNLTIVLGCVLLAARSIRISGRWQIVAGGIAVLGFVILARPEPSVVRAAAMGAIGVLGLRRSARGGLRAISLAVVGLLLYDPWLSTTAGFILSVCATTGIVVLVPWWSRLLPGPRVVTLSIAVPLAAQVACAPMVVVLSNEISVVSVIANVVAAPFVGPATILGLLGGLLLLVWAPLGAAPGTAAAWSAEMIVRIAHWCASLDGASLQWPGPWWLLALLCGAFIAIAPWLLSRPSALIVIVVISLLFVWRPVARGWPPEGWVLVACDVGQGDALVVRAGQNAAVVVDAGPESVAVSRCLDRLGIEHVPLLVLTHLHADHIDGWPGVADARRLDAVAVRQGAESPVPDVPVHPLGRGDHITVGELAVSVLWPRPTDKPALPAEENDRSLVLLIEVRGVRLLLTGDIEKDAQSALSRLGAQIAAHVVKVPHHGSGDHAPRLFEATGARLAIVSVGGDNDYGHPHDRLLRTLRDAGMQARRTDLDGDLAVVSRDGDILVVSR